MTKLKGAIGVESGELLELTGRQFDVEEGVA